MYLRFVDCEPVPMVRRHYATPLYAPSHVLAMCQHNSGVIEPSLNFMQGSVHLYNWPIHTQVTSNYSYFCLSILFFLFFYF